MRESLDISDLLGVPYADGGRTKESGFDCYGLAVEVCRRRGYRLQDVAYPDTRQDTALCNELAPTLGCSRKDGPLQEGDLLEIEAGGVLHIGVALNARMFIHATRSHGVIVSPIKAYRVIGVYGISTRI